MAHRKPRRTKARATPSPADRVLEPQENTLLDMLDKLLNKGVVLNGDVVLGVAGVDLIYLRLSALLCAVDRMFPDAGGRKRRHNRGPRKLRMPSS